MLQTIQNNISRIEQTIAEIDSQITIMTEEYQEIIELLETIPGVGHDGAIGIIAEISLDMDKFPSHKHIASWAGMCPGSNESAGKNKSGRITYGNKYLRAFLVEQAWAASRTKNTYLSSNIRAL
jgi:transposase